MASFQNLNKDEIPSANKITELVPVHAILKKSESWCCAFAPDESYFAWSSGNGIVTLIPWNFCKSTLFKKKQIKVPFKLGVGKHEVTDCFDCSTVSINTGYIVRSMAFGSSADKYEHSSAPFWKRLSSSKHLIFATGHVNGRIRVWDVLTGKLILELMDHSDMVSHLSFNPLGNLILMSASYDGSLKTWDLCKDGNMAKTLKMNKKPIYSCAWSPCGKMLVSVGMCKLVYVWDMETFEVKFKLEGHQHDVVSCAFSPDSCLIVSASWDTRVILWDSHTGKMLKTFGHLHPSPHLIYACGDNGTWIRDVSFSSDGAHIASVADDGYLRFWDIASEENPEAIAPIENSLCCTYAPSGRILAVGNKSGSISFWSAPVCVKSLLYLSRIATRKVTSAENVSKLKIPTCLVDYLLYEQFE